MPLCLLVYKLYCLYPPYLDINTLFCALGSCVYDVYEPPWCSLRWLLVGWLMENVIAAEGYVWYSIMCPNLELELFP